MLFNSYTFILLFLPVTLAGFFAIGATGRHKAALTWLVAASVFFYGWWNPSYLLLIAVSIVTNYSLGQWLGTENDAIRRKRIFVSGIVFNLGLLSYFKYANFFVDNFNQAFDTSIFLEQIGLPLAISFFTFQQVAYLCDTWSGQTQEKSFLRYCLFVTFFPQLIAGPIVHHKEVLPQFADKRIYRFSAECFSVGLTIFVIGLCKKVLIADNIEPYMSPIFAAADAGQPISFFEAWIAVPTNTLFWYFDFSGYSDMALGLARMFGIRLPLNFNSPLKSKSMSELFRRWHITLSRFLRDYLYIPLGGNRSNGPRRLFNLLFTMFLCGLWHGASWNFVTWGLLCGLFLIVNHVWKNLRRTIGGPLAVSNWLTARLAHFTTFMAWAIAVSFLGGASIEGTLSILRSLAGLNGIELSVLSSGVPQLEVTLALLLTGAIAFIMPNAYEITAHHKPAILEKEGVLQPAPGLLLWRRNLLWSLGTGLAFAVCLGYLVRVREFMYFQF